jgi:hypothetical protein
MTAVRWVVEHDQDQLRTGGLVEYPTEADAHTHAGTAGRVWALVTPEVVRVLQAAQAWRDPAARRRLGTTTADLIRAVDAVTRPAEEHT